MSAYVRRARLWLENLRQTPEAARRLWLLRLLLLSGATAVLVTVFGYGFVSVSGDELTVAWDGKQVLMGRVPYLDYFCFLPPLTVYGVAALFKIFGASLACLRLFAILWLAMTTLVLFETLRKLRVPDLQAAAAALLFPALMVPFWPVAGHHWFAVGFGLISLRCALEASGSGSKGGWFLTGLLAGCSGMCLQTEGTLFGLLGAGLWLLVMPPAGRSRLSSAWPWLAGLAVVPAFFALLLASRGALGRAISEVVLWPLTTYRQPGGFNDVSLFPSLAMIGREFWARLGAGPSLDVVLKLASFVGSLAIVLSAPLLLAAALARDIRKPWTARRLWIWSALGTAATFLIYSRGRADWVHLSFFFPLFLVFAASAVEWSLPGRAARAWTVMVLVCLGVSTIRWAAVWTHHPPLLERVLKTDALFVKDGPPSLIEGLRNDDGETPPALYLPNGSLLYFYWAPEPPPIALIMPPSSHVNAPAEYATLSAFARTHQIPYILIERRYAGAFLSEPSPLRDLLRTHYVPFREEASMIFFRRVADASAAK